MGYPPQYGPPSRGEVGRGLAVIMIMVAGLLIGTALTVFTVLNPPSAPASSPSPQDSGHSETSVRQAIQPILDTYSSGSYGDFWDRWSTEAQGLIAREEYARLFPALSTAHGGHPVHHHHGHDHRRHRPGPDDSLGRFRLPLRERLVAVCAPTRAAAGVSGQDGRPDGPGTADRGNLRYGCRPPHRPLRPLRRLTPAPPAPPGTTPPATSPVTPPSTPPTTVFLG